MDIEQTLEQLSQLRYPQQVDVTERVMAQVSQRPYLQPVHRSHIWRRISLVAAAAVVAIVLLNVAFVYTRPYDLDGMGSIIAQANDYSSWYPVEEAAVNPIEYLYED